MTGAAGSTAAAPVLPGATGEARANGREWQCRDDWDCWLRDMGSSTVWAIEKARREYKASFKEKIPIPFVVICD